MESNRTQSFNDLIVVELSLRMFNEAYCIYSAKPKEVTFRKNSALLRVCLELVALKLKANEKYNVISNNINTYLTRILSLNGPNLLNSLVPCGELNVVCCFYLGLSRPNNEIVEYEIDNCEYEKSYY